MEIIGGIIIILIVVVPILPSVTLSLLSALALKRKWKFLYYNSAFASVCNVILLMTFLLSYSYASRGQRREYIWVLLGMSLLGLMFSVGSFVLGFVGYEFNSSSENSRVLPSYPLWASVAAIFCYPFLLLVLLISES